MTDMRDAKRERQKRKNVEERGPWRKEKDNMLVLAIAARVRCLRFEKNFEDTCPRSPAATKHDKRERGRNEWS